MQSSFSAIPFSWIVPGPHRHEAEPSLAHTVLVLFEIPSDDSLGCLALVQNIGHVAAWELHEHTGVSCGALGLWLEAFQAGRKCPGFSRYSESSDTPANGFASRASNTPLLREFSMLSLLASSAGLQGGVCWRYACEVDFLGVEEVG